jgi:hypothetical protein
MVTLAFVATVRGIKQASMQLTRILFHTRRYNGAISMINFLIGKKIIYHLLQKNVQRWRQKNRFMAKPFQTKLIC